MIERFFTPYQAGTAVTGQRIAILAPHPDDEVFGCGASAHKWQAQGRTVQAYILTSGVLKEAYPNQDAYHAQAHLRAEESRAAAKVLNLPEPIFLERQDGELHHDQQLLDRLIEQLQAFAPTTLVVPSVWEMHRDHRATAELALASAESLESLEQISFYEIGLPLIANCLEDISAEQTLKQQAMQCFASQLQQQRYDQHIQGLNTYRAYTLGLEVAGAEAFHTLPRHHWQTFKEQFAPDQASLALHQAAQLAEQQQLQIAQLEQQIQCLKKSLSWRLTAPLRWLRSKV